MGAITLTIWAMFAIFTVSALLTNVFSMVATTSASSRL